jgi:DNA polymerase I-like protein with 3'-5' exonuclease and polymerase domains
MSWNDNKFLAFDFETSGEKGEFALQPWRVKTKQAWATSLVWAYGDPEMPVIEGGLNPTADDMRAMLQHAIDNDMTLVGWNTTFDIGWLIAYGLEDLVMRCKFIDGMLLWKHATQSPEYSLKKSYSLKAAVRELLPEHANYEANIDFHDESPEARRKLHHYNQLDTMFTLQITKHWYNQLTPKQLNAALIEAECLPMIASANVRGLIVDLDKANALVAHLENVANDRLAQLSEHGVTEEIVRSPKQLAELLYKTWGLQCEYFTNSGSESTDKEALHELSLIDPRAKLIREYREALNNKTKFAETLIESAQYNEDGTTHPEARVFGTYSGRLTYSSNQGSGKAQRQTGFALHQMKRGKEYRELIKAPEGFTLVEFDAAGQEFRWMALASNDETMQQLCQPGGDAHAYMGNKINPDASDKKAARQLGKVANLSLQYRTSAKKLKTVARVQYGMPMELPEAVKIHSTYQEAYKGVPQFWEKQISDAKKNKNAETFAGRRVSIDGDWNKNGWAMGSTAINYRIQGTGADQKYLAMKILKPYLLEIGGQFAWDLHDGIYLFIPSNIVGDAVARIKQLLDALPYEQEWGFSSPIPLPWDCKTGTSWGDLKEYNLDAGAGPGDQSQPLNREALPQGGDQSWGANSGLVETHSPSDTVVQVDFRPERTANETALDAALELAKAGIKVFPCQSDKSPVHGFLDWEKQATSDEAKLRRWFLEDYARTARMVGMPCGANNIIAIDPDVPKPEKMKVANGVELFHNLIIDLEIDITNIPVVISPSGGEHYLFAMPSDARYGCSSGQLPANVDVKGDGGYLIAVGSQRADGLAYRHPEHSPKLSKVFGAIPEMPHQLRDMLKTKRDKDRTSNAEQMSSNLLQEALHAIPNNYYYDEREDWVRMAHAIYGASDGQHRDLWLAWCAQRPQKPNEPERVWDSIKQTTSGAGYIRQQLERVGAANLYAQAKAEQVTFDDVDAPTQPQQTQEEIDAEALLYFNASFFAGHGPKQKKRALIKNMVTADGLTFIAGQPSTGKSAISVKMAVAIATGTPFANRKIKQAHAVIYVAAEAPGSIEDRIGIAEHFLDAGDLPIRVMALVPNLADARRRAPFVKSIQMAAQSLQERFNLPVGAVFIDTMARAFEVNDENAAGEMGGIIRAIDEIHRPLGCAGIVVHHMGKSASSGMRGSSALLGAADDELQVTGDTTSTHNERQLRHTKSRSYETGEQIFFDLKVVEIGQDEDGDKITAVRLDFKTESACKKTDAGPGFDDLLVAIHEEPDGDQKAWAQSIGVNRRTLSRWLNDKESTKGLIKKVGAKWELTPKAVAKVRDILNNDDE